MDAVFPTKLITSPRIERSLSVRRLGPHAVSAVVGWAADTQAEEIRQSTREEKTNLGNLGKPIWQNIFTLQYPALIQKPIGPSPAVCVAVLLLVKEWVYVVRVCVCVIVWLCVCVLRVCVACVCVACVWFESASSFLMNQSEGELTMALNSISINEHLISLSGSHALTWMLGWEINRRKLWCVCVCE